MEIISRHYVTPNLIYSGQNGTQKFNYTDLVDGINFWKIILYEGYNMRPGMSIALVDQTVKFTYCSLFFAAAELGLKILIFPDKSNLNDGYSPKMESITKKWGLVDLIYYDQLVIETPALLAMCNRYGKQTMHENVLDTYSIKDHALFEEIKEKIFPNPSDVLVWTATSGTTAEPKLLEYTHKQLHRIGTRNAVALGLSGNSVAHLRNMHHATVLMANFLPAFGFVDDHYEFIIDLSDDINNGRLINFINKNKISRLVIPWKTMLDSLLNYMIKNNIKFGHEVHIVVGGFYVTADYIKTMQATNITKIISMYGSNETFGPILLRNVDQTTPEDNYVESYLGTPPDDFYQIELVGDQLQVTCPAIFPGTKTLEDIFDGNNIIGYTHSGRSNFYRINEVDFLPKDINRVIRSATNNRDVDVVVDLPHQKLYAAVWSGVFDLVDANNFLNIEYPGLSIYKADTLDKRKFEDFKLDQDALRMHFRNQQ